MNKIKKDNLGIGVMSSINFKDRYESCKQTWLKDFDNTFIFGGHGSNTIDSNLISISNAGEDWQSCFLKQQIGLKHMYECNPNFDWYSISGCDNIIFKERVISELSKYSPNDDFFISEPCGIWSVNPTLHQITSLSYESYKLNENNFQAIAGGASFFISNSLMKKCYQIIDEFNIYWEKIAIGYYYGCADVAISLMIKKYFNISAISNPFMFSQNPSFYEKLISDKNSSDRQYYVNIPEIQENIKTPISLHYVKPVEMKSIYDKYKNK